MPIQRSEFGGVMDLILAQGLVLADKRLHVKDIKQILHLALNELPRLETEMSSEKINEQSCNAENEKLSPRISESYHFNQPLNSDEVSVSISVFAPIPEATGGIGEYRIYGGFPLVVTVCESCQEKKPCSKERVLRCIRGKVIEGLRFFIEEIEKKTTYDPVTRIGVRGRKASKKRNSPQTQPAN